MKKALTLLLTTATLALSLTACSGNPAKSSDITPLATQEPQNTSSTEKSSAETENTASQNINSTADEHGNRLFPSIVYNEYNMLEREADEMYFAPASDDYIIVVQEWDETYQEVRLVAFDKKGAVIKCEVRETKADWDRLTNLDEVIADYNGNLIGDSMYYHNSFYDDGVTTWSQKLDVMLSLKKNSLGGFAIDNCTHYSVYISSDITWEQTLGEYENFLTENDFEILSYHTPYSDDYMISKSETISEDAASTYVTGGYTLHKNDAFSYHSETLRSYDSNGNCIQCETVYVFDSPHEAEQYMFANNGYVQKEPTLEFKYNKPDNMELHGSVWLFTFYVDEYGNKTDPCSDEVNKGEWGRNAEIEYWLKPYLTETQLSALLGNE